jgi:hypothetical protein
MTAMITSGSWRLGPDADPGWFDVSAADIQPAQWIMCTVFRLRWAASTFQQEGIHNCLHAISVGRQNRSSKIHLEQIVQILHGEPHVTCRIQDSAGRVHRHTVALPGPKESYNNRWMLLIYTANGSTVNARQVQTCSVLYDLDTGQLLQSLTYTGSVACVQDVDFGSWPHERVICDHEQDQQARDHVMVHGNTRDPVSAQFELKRVWGSLGCAIDALDPSTAQSLLQEHVPDQIGHAKAWYNCASTRAVFQGQHCYARCTGRYQQNNSLGFALYTAMNAAERV